jgi:hypothetical protein
MEPYLSLISGLIGALVGAAASITGILVQARSQAKRDRTKEALALALEDWKMRFEVIKERGGKALPLVVFVQYHTRLLEYAERGALTPAALRSLSEEQNQLIDALEPINEEWRERAAKK